VIARRDGALTRFARLLRFAVPLTKADTFARMDTPKAENVNTAAAPSRTTPASTTTPERGESGSLGLLAQIAEDFRTHDKNPFEPGFWAVAVHRFGKWTQAVQTPVARPPLDLAYKVMSTSADWLWGIHIPPAVNLGRRVRLWHHGCMWLTAKSIGDDVHIRHNTTLGAVLGRNDDPAAWPTIGDRVQLGSGACVLGPISVGDDSVVGANTVVLRTFPASSRVMGIPARLIPGG
jgi:serine O-acetyltransferase